MTAFLLWLAALVGVGAAHAQPLTDLMHAYKALEAGRYAEVEALYAQLQKDRTRTREGKFVFEEFTWKVYWYSDSDPESGSYWPKVDARTRAWLEHSPKSHIAAMTRAFALAYRGQYVQSREGKWSDADKYAAEARRLMNRFRATGKPDPLWHAVNLRVASLEALPRTDLVNLIHAAIAVDPTVVRVWQEAAFALSPDGGNTDDLVWLMRLAARRTAATEGTSMPARVLNATFFHFQDFRARPFSRPGLEWPALHQSFLDWKKRHPGGYSPDLHGALACAARDREATANLMKQVGPGTSTDVWVKMGGKEYQKICRDWATAVPEKSSST